MTLQISLGLGGPKQWFLCDLDLEPGRGNVTRYRVEIPPMQEYVVMTPAWCLKLIGINVAVEVHSELLRWGIVEEWDIVDERWRQVTCPRNLADRLFGEALRHVRLPRWRKKLAYWIARLVTWREGAL